VTTRLTRRRSTNRRLRSVSFRVAIQTTLIALVVGLLACAVADFIVVSRISNVIDHRIERQLSVLAHESPGQINSIDPSNPPDPHVFEGAPVLVWFLPHDSTRVVALNDDTPKLPKLEYHVDRFIDARVDGSPVRLGQRRSALGGFVVGVSTAQIGSILATLLVIEGALAPLALLGLFLAATFIGRRAAAPIERTRLRQLEFTADASHELRTPLSVIEAEVSLALSTPREASEYRGTLERVSRESKRLRHIVQDLLWLARLDALPTESAHEPVDVATVAESCVERFGVLAAERGISLTMGEPSALAPIIVAPADWVDQLIAVLLDNACRYANDSGHIEVHVDASTDEVTLRIDDDGPGFASREREVVLERFRRASDAPGGAGLGLAIAQAVVDATGGRISLDDASLGGASVKVWWPRVQNKPGRSPAHGGRHPGVT
jgi:signal transduction histidine kinase